VAGEAFFELLLEVFLFGVTIEAPTTLLAIGTLPPKSPLLSASAVLLRRCNGTSWVLDCEELELSPSLHGGLSVEQLLLDELGAADVRTRLTS
jgi:hypothetical protein